MRRPRLAGLLVILATAPALAGCGADDATPRVAVAKAATTPTTARVTGAVRATGFGLQKPADVPFRGVTALRRPELDLTADVGPLVQRFQPLVSSLVLDVRLRRGVAYLKVPSLARAMVPGQKAWASLDVRRLAANLGVTPARLLQRALRARKQLKQVGTEEIGGVRTRHLSGVLRLRHPGVKRAIAPLVDLWVGDDRIVRRERVALDVPAHRRMPAGRIVATADLSDFGTPLATDLPSATQTFDATGVATRMAKRLRARHHR